jgi:hypothetical protein
VFGVAFVFTPSIVPTADDTVYLVEDYLGGSGRIFPETSVAESNRETILRDLYAGQYHDPVRVVAFNTREGWSRDVSYEFAVESNGAPTSRAKTSPATLPSSCGSTLALRSN